MRQLTVLFDRQEQVEQELSKIDDRLAAIRQKLDKFFVVQWL
jgi:ABC-type Fe3+-hydroxamate transport system substrate-binding protein